MKKKMVPGVRSTAALCEEEDTLEGSDENE